jgi:hypothetical protein
MEDIKDDISLILAAKPEPEGGVDVDEGGDEDDMSYR